MRIANGWRGSAALFIFCLTLLFVGCNSDTDSGADGDSDLELDGDSTVTDCLCGVEPSSASAFGYVPITLQLSQTDIEAQDIDALTVGGIPAIDLEVTESGDLTIMVQGHPQGGAVEIELSRGGDTVPLGTCFTYDTPTEPELARVVAFGASLTQGVQCGVPSYQGSLMSPAAQVARQLGAYMPLPLLKPGLFPRISSEQIGPAPECRVPATADHIVGALSSVLPKFTDPDTGDFSFHNGLLSPELEPANLAVGNTIVGEMLHGPDQGNTGGVLLSHMVFDPHAEILDPVQGAQLDHVLDQSPSLILTTDLFGNDVIWGLGGGNQIDFSLSTPIDELRTNLADVLQVLADSGADVFLGTLPRPSVLPSAIDQGARSLEAGMTPAEISADIASVDELGAQANAALLELVEPYDNIHVVDLFGWAEEIAENGLTVGTEQLGVQKFGGLVGLDGTHFTNTGYAVVANLYLEAINEWLGTDYPLVDLEAVLAADPESPAAIKSMGLDACNRVNEFLSGR